MIVSWWWVLNTELIYDLFFQKEHCLNVVLERWIGTNKYEDRKDSYEAVEVSLEGR